MLFGLLSLQFKLYIIQSFTVYTKPQVESVTKGTKQTNKYSYVTIVEAKLPIPYGTHHTKMMVLRSDAGQII